MADQYWVYYAGPDGFTDNEGRVWSDGEKFNETASDANRMNPLKPGVVEKGYPERPAKNMVWSPTEKDFVEREPVYEILKLNWLRRFGIPERTILIKYKRMGYSTDTVEKTGDLETLLNLIPDNGGLVHMQDPIVVDAVSSWVTEGIITEERKTELLAAI